MIENLRRVLVLYNTDYDDELKAASPADVSAVQEAARAVCRAIEDHGLGSELLGVHGRGDLDQVFRQVRQRAPDLVFNLVESLDGDTRNEMLVPAMLDLLRVPYTGPSAFSIGLCLNKDRAKDVMRGAGVAVPPGCVLAGEADLVAAERLDYPCFVKLVREDASIGIEAANVARDPAALIARTRQLWQRYRQPVLAERYIDGREVNVTVLGNGGDRVCLPLHEIDFSGMPAERPRIVSYAAKWEEGHVDYKGTKPVPLRDATPQLCAAIESTARSAFAALGLRDFGRVDQRIDADGTPWVIDVNPNCDLSPGAGVSVAARAAGLEYPQLIGRICETAWRRHVDGDSQARAA